MKTNIAGTHAGHENVELTDITEPSAEELEGVTGGAPDNFGWTDEERLAMYRGWNKGR